MTVDLQQNTRTPQDVYAQWMADLPVASGLREPKWIETAWLDEIKTGQGDDDTETPVTPDSPDSQR